MLVAITAILNVVLLLVKAYFEQKTEVKQTHVDNAKKISDAIASGDVSRINSAVQFVRR